MTVSIARLSAQSSVKYLLRTTMCDDAAIEGDPTGYYIKAGTPVGRWLGSGLAGISRQLLDPVTSEDATAVYSNAAHPDTGSPLGRGYGQAAVAHRNGEELQRKAVAGFDLTFSVPKSVSVLWAMAPYSVQKQVLAAHHQAVDDVLKWLEETAIRSRTGRGGVAHVAAMGAIAAAFDHWESRDRDPQLHTHVVIANRVQRVTDGAWVTVDSRTIYQAVVAAGEHYNGLLFDRLQNSLGTATGFRPPPARDRNPRHELIGVDDGLLAEFSNRSRLINLESERLIEEWKHSNGRGPSATIVSKLRQQATLSTRQVKDKEPLPLTELSQRWQARVRRLGLDPKRVLSATIHRATLKPITLANLADPWVTAAADATRELVARRRATWSRWNLLAEAERVCASIRCATAEDRRQMIDAVTTAAEFQCVALNPYRYSVPLGAQSDLTIAGRSVFEFDGSRLYSDTGILANEQLIMEARNDDDGPGLPLAAAKASLTKGQSGRTPLASDQRAAALEVLTSGRRLDAVVGPAGSGKTTTMAAIRTSWEQQYGAGSVIALAPAAASADVLGRELGLNAENITKWLYESIGQGAALRAQRFSDLTRQTPNAPWRRQRLIQRMAELAMTQEYWNFRPNQLVIIDEASMVSTVQFAALVHQARDAGAKILLTGDPAQLDAIDAGGILGWLDRQDKTVRLTTIRRFNHEWEGPASLLLRGGDFKAVQMYAARGRIKHGGYADMIDRAYGQWAHDVDAGLDSILIAPDNDAVAVLNERAHAELVDRGVVDAEHPVALSDGLLAGRGDIVIARKNDRTLTDQAGDFIRNGTLIRLTSTPDRNGYIRGTRLDTEETICLTPEYLYESAELGYATTAHRSQGLTVDTSHTVLTQGHLTRELFYVGMTRGRASNTAYVCETSPAPDDAAHEPEGADWAEIIDGVLAAEGAEHSAHEVMDLEGERGHTLHQLAAEFDYLAQLAGSANLSLMVDEIRPGLSHKLSASPSWGAAVTAWRNVNKVRSHVAATIVQGAVQNPGSAIDLASVIHARLRGAVSPLQVADGSVFDEQITTTRRDLADMIGQVRGLAAERVSQLSVQAVTANEPWTRNLVNSLPEGVDPIDQNALIKRIAVYRDRWLIGDHPDPLGTPPTDYEWERTHDWELLADLTSQLMLPRRSHAVADPAPSDYHRSLNTVGLGI